MLKDRMLRIYLIIIVVLTAIVYANSVNNDYNLDDVLVTDNELVKGGTKNLGKIFTTRYLTGKYINVEYRPVARATFAIEYEFFGKRPHISHFINLLIYIVTCAFLFVFLLKIIDKNHSKLIFLSVLLFALHPLHTEVVCSLKNREVLLSFLFGLWSLILLVDFFIRDNYKVLRLISSVFLFAFAVITKLDIIHLSIIIPFILVCIKVEKKYIIASSVFYFIVMVVVLASPTFLLSEQFDVYNLYVENPLFEKDSFVVRLFTGFYVLGFYLLKMLLPFTLSFYYGFNTIQMQSYNTGLGWISLVGVLMVLFLLYRYYGYKSVVFISFVISILSITLFLNIIKPVNGIVAERLAFLSSASFCVFIVFALVKLMEKVGKPKFFDYTVYAILILFSLKVISRNPDWKNKATLFQADIEHLQNSSRANFMAANNIASDLKKNRIAPDKIISKQNDALKYYNRAIKVYPKYYDAWYSLGAFYLSVLNNPKEALRCLLVAKQANDAFFENLDEMIGVCYQAEGDLKNAEKFYLADLEKHPHHKTSFSNMISIYHNKKDDKNAFDLSYKIVKTNPKTANPYFVLGDLYLFYKDTANAVFYLNKSYEISRDTAVLNKLRALNSKQNR